MSRFYVQPALAVDGDIAEASDINNVNLETVTGFNLVEAEIDASVGVVEAAVEAATIAAAAAVAAAEDAAESAANITPFSNVAAMKAATLTVGKQYDTYGYFYAQSGGGARYFIQTIADYLLDRGKEPDGWVNHYVNGNSAVAVIRYNDALNVVSCGARGNGTTNATLALQAVINYLHDSGGGNAYVPIGTYLISTSAETSTWTNYDGGTHLSSEACLILRSGVQLLGANKVRTIIKSADPTKTVIFLANASDCTIKSMTIQGGFTGLSGAGHGFFAVVENLDDDVVNLRFEDLYIKNHASYGIGLNDGYLSRLYIKDVEIYFVGADGIDIKSRSTNTDEINNSNLVDGLTARAYGQRVVGSVGLDITGMMNAANITCRDFGVTGAAPWIGIRLRPGTTNNYIGKYSNVSNVIVDCGGNADCSGIDIQGSKCNITNVTIRNPTTGMLYAGSATINVGCNISNVVCTGHSVRAFYCTVSGTGLNMTNFNAREANGAVYHYVLYGSDLVLTNCTGDDTALEREIAVGTEPSLILLGSSAIYEDTLSFDHPVAGRAALKSKGPSTNIDIQISPKGAGDVRLGKYTSGGVTAISGYLTVKDNTTGGVRKLAVLS